MHWAGRITQYTYDENNNVIGVTKPDGSVTTTVYDSKQRITSTVERKADNTIISGFEFTYHNTGNVATEKNLATNTTLCYTYDKLKRLTSVELKDAINMLVYKGFTIGLYYIFIISYGHCLK